MKEPFKTIEEDIQTYTEEELRIWNKGYLAAIEGLLEQIQEDQLKILNKLLMIEGQHQRKGLKNLLQSRLIVLDSYEEHFRKRLLPLQRDAE